MTSELSEDVVLQISSPHIVTEASAGGRGAAELGRRLLAAARGGHTQAVLELLARGAPFTADWLGTSALHLAAAGAHLDTCAVLLRAGVSRDARTKVERTPLHLAAHAGHAAAAALLLRHGAAPDARDMLRMTPLHWAAERGHADTASLLLRHGADPAARTKFGKTPPQLAEARGHAALAAALRAAPPAPAAPDPPAERAEIPAAEQRRALESIERPREPEPAPEPEAAAAGGAEAEALLRRHGIALLPRDEGSTVLNAIQSGRTVVLSDAGKLMLKESVGGAKVVLKDSAGGANKAAPKDSVAGANKAVLKDSVAGANKAVLKESAGGANKVVLTATPVRSPPRAGVKIFTLNNNTLAPAGPAQFKFVSVAPGGSPRAAPLKAKQRVSRLAPRPAAPAPAAAAPPAPRPAVKIIMHKTSFDKIVAGSGKAGAGAGAGAAAEGAGAGAGELAAAQAAVARLTREVAALKQRLARYEPV